MRWSTSQKTRPLSNKTKNAISFFLEYRSLSTLLMYTKDTLKIILLCFSRPRVLVQHEVPFLPHSFSIIPFSSKVYIVLNEIEGRLSDVHSSYRRAILLLVQQFPPYQSALVREFLFWTVFRITTRVSVILSVRRTPTSSGW